MAAYRVPPQTMAAVAIDDEWVAGAEIVIVRATGEGALSRPLEIPDFPLRVKANQR